MTTTTLVIDSSKIAEKIAAEYRAVNLTPEWGDFWVVDRRNLRVVGPFAYEHAMKLCADMNDFVRRNARLGPAFPFAVYNRHGSKEH